jgi:hypothetical protein
VALSAVIPRPPGNVLVLEDDGQLSQAWLQYFNKLSDLLKVLPEGFGESSTDGSDAVPGAIGEYLEATIADPVVLDSAVTTDILTLDLTPGDWDVHGWIGVSGTGMAENGWGIDGIDTVGVPGNPMGWTGPHRRNVAALTTITLRTSVTYTAGGAFVANARLGARRVR